MKLGVPVRRRVGGRLRVEVSVSLRTEAAAVPAALWFEFPAELEAGIPERSDGFVLALLPLAQALGEPVEVDGVLSAALLPGLAEWQRVACAWWGLGGVVPVRAAMLEEEAVSGARRCGAAFSGGVDSFHTLFAHLAGQATGRERVAEAVLMHGFDVPLEDARTFETLSSTYTPLLAELGVRLVSGATNARAFTEPCTWEVAHGAVLAGTAHVLAGLWDRFLIPGSNAYAEPQPWGSDWRLDHLLSSDGLRIVHDGADAWRVDKTIALARRRETWHSLRVCWEEVDGVRNCGRCAKCLRTMVALETAGTLGNYSVFNSPLTRANLRAVRFSPYEFQQVGELASRVRSLGRPDLAGDLVLAVWKSRLWHRARQLKRRLF